MHIYTSAASTAPPFKVLWRRALRVLATCLEVLWRRPSRSPVRRASRSIGTKFLTIFFNFWWFVTLPTMSYTTPIAIKNMRFYEIMIILQTAPLPAPQLNNDSIKGHQIYMFPFQSRLVLFLAACPAATGPVKCRRFPSMKHPSLMKMPSHTQVTNHKRTFWKRKSRVLYL